MTHMSRSRRAVVVPAARLGILVAWLAASGCAAQSPDPSGGLSTGMQLFMQHDIDGADAAFASLPADASSRDRATALQTRALFAWRYRRAFDEGEALLREALGVEALTSKSWAGLARLETARDQFDAAREAALEAIATAETEQEAIEGTISLARVAIGKAELTFDRTPHARPDSLTIEWLREAHDRLTIAVAEAPGDVAIAGPLLRTSIFLGDGEGLLAAWRSYYLTIVGKPDAGVLNPSRETLDALLPQWRDREPSAAEVARVVVALAASGLYREAWLAARTPGWTQGVEASDPETLETLTYARFVQEGSSVTDEHYRRVAIGEGDTKQYRAAFLETAEPLWEAIRWDDQRPSLTLQNLIQETSRRFNAQLRGGKTAGYDDLHFGHRVIDEEISVSQYGHEAVLRFVVLDGMVSNGFQSWAWDFRAQHGGWASSGGITQVRPAYAGEAQEIWRTLNDSIALQRVREETERESATDWDRAAEDPHAFLPGLAGRLRLQGAGQLLEQLRAEGATGDELQRRFLVELQAAVFASSIEAHEGRHAIDGTLSTPFSSADLEFRAKLSEVVFAPHPRIAFGGIIGGNIGDSTPHGQANLRIMRGLVTWLSERGDQIPGLDPSRPLLPQLDLLSDDQLRAAMASMDPLAR